MTTPLLSRSSALGSRLLAGVGTLTLLAAIGLFASRPARTAGGPIPVTVANAPLGVTVADNPAKQPFQASVPILLQNGLTAASGPSIPVPVGKRLVIQTVSLWRNGTLTPGEGVRGYVGCTVNGSTIFYPLPFAPTDGTVVPGTMQAVTLYADPGTDLFFNAFRNGASGNETDLVSVTGYLVDVP